MTRAAWVVALLGLGCSSSVVVDGSGAAAGAGASSSGTTTSTTGAGGTGDCNGCLDLAQDAHPGVPACPGAQAMLDAMWACLCAICGDVCQMCTGGPASPDCQACVSQTGEAACYDVGHTCVADTR